MLALAAAEESAEEADASEPVTEPVASATDTDSGSSVLAGPALAVGLLALAVAAFTALRGRRTV